LDSSPFAKLGLVQVLHIGNIRFSEKKELVSMEPVTQGASLLGTSAENLLQEITGTQQVSNSLSPYAQN